jgi:hypothetical protein
MTPEAPGSYAVPRRRALVVLVVFAVIGGAVATLFPRLVSWDVADFDPLLAVCWTSMLGLACVDVRPRRDAVLAAVALVGGALIESWGTRSGLWTYFDGQQPPPFILPAWPAAAIATERIARPLVAWSRRIPPRAGTPLYAVAVLGYVAWLLVWSRSGLHHPLTWVALACVAVTAVSGDDRRGDLARFAAGCLVGFPLEYWGTTRGCWTYWSGETPPIVTVLSHGFATLAFARGAALVQRALATRRGDTGSEIGAPDL